jgi:glycosyltransferase involved in cell wall biosynthesis
MEVTAPEISVIIPTFRRSRLVPAAIDSVLRQTAVDLELLVVIDGPDPETQRALVSIADSRLRIVQLPRQMGAAEARNQGIQNARGKWIAFLDDDDTWFPTKLEAQLRTAQAASVPFPVVTCRVLARSEQAVHYWPRRRPAPGEPLGEYLFCRSTFFSGEGMVQTSTWFAPRELLARHPFDPELPAMCDVEWLLRVTRDPRVQLLFVPTQEPLATWNIETGRERISNGIRWKFQLDWARTHRALLTSRAYAGLLLTWSGNTAARDRDWSAFFKLPAEAFREGTPSPQEVVTYLGYWLIPSRLSGTLAGWFAHLHRLWTDSS